jgi:16S rRNA (guanine527-N7)-methyltransferase
MEPEAIQEILGEYIPAGELDTVLLHRVQVHLGLLLRWNLKMNLTAVRTAPEMLRRHFGESLFAAQALLARDTASAVMDVGSGAGFPGLPLLYWAPGIRLTLIEGHGKKATFLRELERSLDLPALRVLNGRAEDVAAQAELVTMRAVERFETVLPVALRLVAPGGRLGLLIGEAQQAAAERLLPSGSVIDMLPAPGSKRRVLLTWRAPETFHVEHQD